MGGFVRAFLADRATAAVPALSSLVICSSAFAQGKDEVHAAAGSLSSAITTAALTALVGGVGWIAAYVLNGQRENRIKRLQLTIEHTSTQIREFYAPLVALTDQLNTLASVKKEIVKDKSHAVNFDLTATFYDKFFLPIHEEINAILKAKVHLLEGDSTPSSFLRYFEHYASEKAYWQLVKAEKDVTGMQVPDYPPDFYKDVRRGYQTVMKRYEASLSKLRHPRAGWLFRALAMRLVPLHRGFDRLAVTGE